MEEFGYIDRLNGLNYLHWEKTAVYKDNRIRRLIFPPRDITNSDVLYVYDKDLCRVIPAIRKGVTKDDLYKLPENSYGDAKTIQKIIALIPEYDAIRVYKT
ncbi:hypothetical protein EVAR_101499_1 [Eumeta japonica]|uniref:Uncharacterized protein n=1 Tax=Eumeta variegata TaxID=151549 RepID=A0A4C1T6F8_EUMVA|nr:hypothetical protein EVAR_101499_1 [Eumeta japonica]